MLLIERRGISLGSRRVCILKKNMYSLQCAAFLIFHWTEYLSVSWLTALTVSLLPFKIIIFDFSLYYILGAIKILFLIIIKIRREWLAIITTISIKTDKFTDMDGILSVQELETHFILF